MPSRLAYRICLVCILYTMHYMYMYMYMYSVCVCTLIVIKAHLQ